LIAGDSPTEASSRRLDQWLWFARLAKTRSLAARLCAGGGVAVNGTGIRKPNHPIRAGDIVITPQGAVRRTVRVLALGTRRGPASEARRLYEEISSPVPLFDIAPVWEPLLTGSDQKD
jgi:ribosome-associated heat shock protein Hsp15